MKKLASVASGTSLKTVLLASALTLFAFTFIFSKIFANAAEENAESFVEVQSSSGAASCHVDSSKPSCKTGSGEITFKDGTVTVTDVKAKESTLFVSGKVSLLFKSTVQTQSDPSASPSPTASEEESLSAFADSEEKTQRTDYEDITFERIVLAKNADATLKTENADLVLTNSRTLSKEMDGSLDEKYAAIAVSSFSAKEEKSGKLTFSSGNFELNTERGSSIIGISSVSINDSSANIISTAWQYGINAEKVEMTGGTATFQSQHKAGVFVSDTLTVSGKKTTLEASLFGDDQSKTLSSQVVGSVEAEGAIEVKDGATLTATSDDLKSPFHTYGIISHKELKVTGEATVPTYVLGSGDIGITTLYPEVEKATDIIVEGAKLEGSGRGGDGIQAKNIFAKNKATLIGRAGAIDIGTIGDLQVENSKLSTAGGTEGVLSSGNVTLFNSDCSISGQTGMLSSFKNITMSGTSNVRIVSPLDQEFPFGVVGVHAKEKILFDFAPSGQITVIGKTSTKTGYGGAVVAGGPTLAYNPLRFNQSGDDIWARFFVNESGKVVQATDADSQPQDALISLGKKSIITNGKIAKITAKYNYNYALVDENGEPSSETAIYAPVRPYIVSFLEDNWPPVLVAFLLLILIILLYFIFRQKRALLIIGTAKESNPDPKLVKNISDYARQHHYWFKKVILSTIVKNREGQKVRFVSKINELLKKYNYFVSESMQLVQGAKTSAISGTIKSYTKPNKIKRQSLKELFNKFNIHTVYIVGQNDEVSIVSSAKDAAKLVYTKKDQTIKPGKERVVILETLVKKEDFEKIQEQKAELKKLGIALR